MPKVLSPEEKAKRAAYYREWRKKNPDKVAAIAARHWAKKAATLKNQQ